MRTWGPPAFVLFSLAALVILPTALDRRISALRDHRLQPAQEARGEVNDLRLATSRAEAAARGYWLTGRETFLAEVDEAIEDQENAFRRLLPLVRQLDEGLGQAVEDLQAATVRARVERAALLGRAAEAPPDALVLRGEDRHERLLATADDVKVRVVDILEGTRGRIRTLERTSSIVTILLALLALISAVMVIWLGRAFRRRAMAEGELRAAAFSLAETIDVAELLGRIAVRATRAVSGSWSYVERVDTSGESVQIVAATGDRAPAVGTRAAWPGSLTAEAVRTGSVEVLPHVARDGRPMGPELMKACSGCAAVIIPLSADHEVDGALVVLRPPGRTFSPAAVLQLRIYGVLAALALRKAILLQQARTQQEELKRMAGTRARMTRGFSHDVKNPLGAADAHAQLLADGLLGDLSPQQQDSVRRIRAAVRSALDLIEDVVDLARVEAGQLEVRRREVDAAELALDLVREHEPSAATAELELRHQLPQDLPMIATDPARVRQILGNLLSNAIKYTPPGGTVTLTGELRVGRRSADPREWVTLSIADTGPGIAPADVPKLFEEFQRIDAGAAPGTGLGLAISDSLARLLGGEITVETELGEGSVFTLWLPKETKSGDNG